MLLLMNLLKFHYYRGIWKRNFDIICLSETFLNSSLDSEDDRLKIEGYNLIRSDHPSVSNKGGVCFYYKEHIPLVRRDDLCTLSNCLVSEIRLENEKCFPTCIYGSPSQTQHEFDNFFTNLNTLMDHINNELSICSVITGNLVVELILSHHQLDINKLLTNLHIL